jgi:hypothetical protein
MGRASSVAFAAVLVATVRIGRADTPAPAASTPEQLERATDTATTTLPAKTQIAFKPSYTFPNGADRYKAELLFEPVLRYRGFLIPDLEVPGFWSISRLQLPAESEQNALGNASGLGDLTVTDLLVHAAGPLNVGLGFASVFPMATDPALGQGKWQLGPALGLRVMPPSALHASVLVQNFYSVAGDSQSPGLGYVSVQPFVSVHFPGDWFLSTDATMTFAWRGRKTSVPVDLGAGHAFSEHFVGTMQLWYTTAGDEIGDVKVRAVLAFQP